MSSGREAYKRAMSNKAGKWPAHGEGNRLSPDCDPVLKPSFKLQPGESVFTIGSCFARNIERRLSDAGFRVPSLDFDAPAEEGYPGAPISNILNKYSPEGMLNEILFARHGEEFRKASDFLVEGAAGQVADYQLHIHKPVEMARALERRHQVRELFRSAIAESRVTVITLGLIEAWYDRLGRVYLNDHPSHNMVKLHGDRFHFEVLTVIRTLETVTALIDNLAEMRGGDLKIMLTVSPVPLQRTFTNDDVIVANCRSKSLLRGVAGEIADKYDFVDYVPSYESVIYSDFASSWVSDQVHVSQERISHVVNRILDAYIDN